MTQLLGNYNFNFTYKRNIMAKMKKMDKIVQNAKSILGIILTALIIKVD